MHFSKILKFFLAVATAISLSIGNAQEERPNAGSSAGEVDMQAETYDALVSKLSKIQQFVLNLGTDTYRQSGNPMGCGVLFEAWVADSSGPELEPLFIKGGVNYLFLGSGVPVIQIKSALADPRPIDGGYATEPKTPNMMYASTPSWTLAGKEYRNQQEAGSLSASSVYPDSNLEGLQALASTDQIEVSFSREQGGIDLSIMLQLGEADALNLKTCLLAAYSHQINQ